MKLEQAAQALLAHWDTPAWKYLKPTGDLMADLREALAEPQVDWQEEAMRLGGLNAKHVGELRKLKAEQAEQEPVYAFRRKGQDSFCTCDKERYEELVDKPNLFEVTTFYAAPVRTKDLTDDEIYIAVGSAGFGASFIAGYRAVIAADREKNK